MTCIVAMEFRGHVYMASDTLGSDSVSKVTLTQPKVFVKDGILFGYTASFRFGQILEHCLPTLNPPTEDHLVYAWLVREFVPLVRDALKEHGYLNDKNAEEQEGYCLLGIGPHIWTLQGNFSVIRHTIGYAAVGSRIYAMASIFTSLAYKVPKSVEDVMTVLQTALMTAAYFDPHVGTTTEFITNNDTPR